MLKGTGGTAIRTVCFHGRREKGGGEDFLLAARLLGRAAERAGLFAQVRTPSWPKPAGSPDRAMVRMSPSPFLDMDMPRRFHLEVAADPRLAVIPPMGGALLPGGRILVNAPSLPVSPERGPVVHSADLSALAARRGGALGIALAAGAWAVLGELTPEMPFQLRFLEEALAAGDVEGAPPASLALAQVSYDAVKHARPSGLSGSPAAAPGHAGN